jgi:osmotically-inducible protein OsmY
VKYLNRETITALFVGVFVIFAFGQLGFGLDENNLADRVYEKVHLYYPGDVAIDVTIREDAEVVLEGTVETLWDKYRIFEIVSRIPRVKTISNQLVVDAPIVADEVIRDNIRDEMRYNEVIVEQDRIKVEVTNGIVFLDGKVSFSREKKMMETLASWHKGVKGIENRLEVLPPEKAKSDENLATILRDIREHEFPTDRNASIRVEDGVVYLSGTVTNLWSKENMEDEFSDLLGVKKVVNNLKVKPIYGTDYTNK